MAQQSRIFYFVPKDYEEIKVTATTMPVSFSRHILMDTLNEDADLVIREFPNFRTIYIEDELFARVWLTTVGQSAVTHVAVR